MAVLTGKRMKDSFYWFYFQFIMITCLIDLEPWEQVILSSILAVIFIMLVFTAYVFIPSHLHLHTHGSFFVSPLHYHMTCQF
uniref:Serine palmitoyltransferase small subunit B n=1 Tax=Varanus komodoensis TaxID=61221 RepID=A0A8D2IX24_VARKO